MQPPLHEPEATPLDYGTARSGFNKRQFWAGLAVSLLVCTACFGVLFVTGAYYFEMYAAPNKPARWAWLAMGTVAAALAASTYLVVRTQRRRGGRGLLLGFLLGLGLAALPIGTCFYFVGVSAVGG